MFILGFKHNTLKLSKNVCLIGYTPISMESGNNIILSINGRHVLFLSNAHCVGYYKVCTIFLEAATYFHVFREK